MLSTAGLLGVVAREMAESLDCGDDGAFRANVRLEELLVAVHQEAPQPRFGVDDDALTPSHTCSMTCRSRDPEGKVVVVICA